MQMQKQWWIENDDVWLEVPTMHGERRILPGKGSPILQVRFHSSVEPGSAMLGLRTQDKVAIFHPTHEKASSEAASGSRLVLDPLYNVDVDQPDGAPYVDFTFNPWFSQQLALIDQGGNWKVLEFRTRKMDHVARQWAGSSVNDDTSLTDGWARVAWVMNIEVVAICTRTTLKLINISADQAIVVEHVSVELSGPIPWILDFAIVPEHLDKFIVLTTTHILLYKANDEPSGGTMTSLLMKVRHFRGPEDTTLNLKTWNEGDGMFDH
jgi:RNA polymerase I-specific transcription initiation factor RRN6